jgi:hypothetical protein
VPQSEVESAGPVKWAVLAWEVLANIIPVIGSRVERRAEEFESERV